MKKYVTIRTPHTALALSLLAAIALSSCSSDDPTTIITTENTGETGGSTNLVALKLPSLNYSSGALLYSSPSLTSGVSYTIYKGGSYTGGSDFNGYYSGGNYTTGTAATTFTSSSVITTLGTTSGGRGR